MLISFIVEICTVVEQIIDEMRSSKNKIKITLLKRLLSNILGAMAVWLHIFVELCLILWSTAVATVRAIHESTH